MGRKQVFLTGFQPLSGGEAGSHIMVRVEKWSAGADQTHHGQRDRRTALD
jgi:hypothetical protein